MTTTYVILKQSDGTVDYSEMDSVTAHGRRAALSAYLNGTSEEGIYVAVPERSWRPVKVTAQTKTQLRFE